MTRPTKERLARLRKEHEQALRFYQSEVEDLFDEIDALTVERDHARALARALRPDYRYEPRDQYEVVIASWDEKEGGGR